MAYKLTPFGVLRLSDSAHIPADEANSDYIDFLKWQSDGNTPAPADVESEPSRIEQIEALERENALALQRATREVMLAVMEKEAAAAGLTLAQLRQVNPGYRRVKELDEQIAALRAQPVPPAARKGGK